MEVRFVPARPWAHFPGLFADAFSEAFPREEETGLEKLPEILRDRDPGILHSVFRRMVGEQFTLLFGPRTVGLATRQNDYPGWEKFWPAMDSVLKKLSKLKVIREPSRFGLRYINFFKTDVFENLNLGLAVNGRYLPQPETGLHTVFHDAQFRHFVQINNAAVIADADNKPALGSILDIDTTYKAKEAKDLADAANIFREAHLSEKKVFFGLLKNEYVDRLAPEY